MEFKHLLPKQKLDANGRIYIPSSIRKKLKIEEGSEALILFDEKEKKILIDFE
ncbi:AbrB/MazE/SpoVT family DNA-binding domain-containing protein [Orenia metallireducens]|nr:AbrB/MazE/SpoVT family DNA-binding domain-containing protein [Orenia metallireducens]